MGPVLSLPLLCTRTASLSVYPSLALTHILVTGPSNSLIKIFNKLSARSHPGGLLLKPLPATGVAAIYVSVPLALAYALGASFQLASAFSHSSPFELVLQVKFHETFLSSASVKSK